METLFHAYIRYCGCINNVITLSHTGDCLHKTLFGKTSNITHHTTKYPVCVIGDKVGMWCSWWHCAKVETRKETSNDHFQGHSVQTSVKHWRNNE